MTQDEANEILRDTGEKEAKIAYLTRKVTEITNEIAALRKQLDARRPHLIEAYGKLHGDRGR